MQPLSFSLEGMTVQEFERHLEDAIALNDPQKATQYLAELVKKHDLRCTEINKYIKTYRLHYLKSLDQEIQASTDFATAKGRKRDQLLHSFKLKAISTLNMHFGPFTHALLHNQDGYQDSWVIAHLIFGTYFRIKRAPQEREKLRDSNLVHIKGFEILNSDKCCSHCQKLAKRTYQKHNLPELPFHIGCGCWLAPVFNFD